MFNLFKKKHIENILFLHIPKTGGSTFIGHLKDSLGVKHDIPTHKTNKIKHIEIKHVDFQDNERKFIFPKVFHPNFKYNGKIFIIIRNPIDRLLSEFNFQYHILNGKNGNKQAAIISKLKPTPQCFEEYIEFKETHNYQTKFLIGRPINDKKPITFEDFKIITYSFESLPFFFGTTNNYSEFLNIFESESKIKLRKTVVVRKKTPEALKIEISEQIRERIKALNQFDFALYDYAQQQGKSSKVLKRFKFNKDDNFII